MSFGWFAKLISLILNEFNWQAITYFALICSAFAAIATLIWKIKSDRKQLRFTVFIRFLNYANKVNNEQEKEWINMKRAKLTLQEVAKRIRDRDRFLDYLKRELEKKEPFVLQDYIMLEREIRLLNLLNEMCKFALEDSQIESILKSLYSNKISYYLRYLEFLLHVTEKEKNNYQFPVLEYLCLQKLSWN